MIFSNGQNARKCECLFPTISSTCRQVTCSVSYAILNINFQTFSRFFRTFSKLNFSEWPITRSNTGTIIFKTMWVKLYQSWIQYYERSSLEKYFPFFILTDQKNFFQTFPGWKKIKLFRYLSILFQTLQEPCTCDSPLNNDNFVKMWNVTFNFIINSFSFFQVTCTVPSQRGTLVGLAPPNKDPSPPNWKMKHYKSVDFWSIFRMWTSYTKVSPLLRTFWRRFWTCTLYSIYVAVPLSLWL